MPARTSDPPQPIPLRLRLAGSPRAAEAEAVVEIQSLRTRLVRGGVVLLGAILLSLLFLPVPLMHLAGIPVMLAGIWLAQRRLRHARVLRSASGTCPACGEPTRLFVGFGGTPFRLPLATSCAKCARQLLLDHPADRPFPSNA